MLNDQEKRQSSILSYRRIKSFPFFKYLIAALVVVSVVLGYRLIASKGLLDISKVSIKSVNQDEMRYVNRELIKQTILDLKAKNYFELNIESLQKKVIEQDPFIEGVFFTKTFPNKILVEVTQRNPYLIVQLNTTECNLLTEKGYVLDKVAYQSKKECSVLVEKYKVPVLKLADSKIPFDINTQSAFFTIQDIAKLRKVFAEYGVVPIRYEMKNGVLYSYVDKNTYIVTSTNQDITVQLSRFVVVINEIEQKGIDYKEMDLRYKRPVIIRK